MHSEKVLCHSHGASMMMKSKAGMKLSSCCAVARSCVSVIIVFVIVSSPSPSSNVSWSWGTILLAEAISSSDSGNGNSNSWSRSVNNDNNDDSNAPFLVMSEILLDDASNGCHAASTANNGDGNNIISAQENIIAENDDGLSSSSSSSSLKAVGAEVTKNENGSVAGKAGAERELDEPILRSSEVESSSSTGGGGGGGGGSDTEEEDEDDFSNSGGAEIADPVFPTLASTSTPLRQSPPTRNADFVKSTKTILETDSSFSSPSNSQPLRTLKRLQAMLDDTDYATTTADKLWTSKDRAKYRRTRRTEQHQQRRHQHGDSDEYVGQNSDARKLRHMERQRMIREEQERRKELELLEQQQRRRQQQQQPQPQIHESYFDETAASDFTDDDTDDTDGYYGGGHGANGGFELPNLPVYLSDGETDELSEENEGIDPSPAPPLSSRPINPPIINTQHQKPQQGFHHSMQPPPLGLMGQNDRGRGQPYFINPEHQQTQNQEEQQTPTQYRSSDGSFQNYRQQYPPYSQHLHVPQSSQQYLYGHNPHQQQVTMDDRHQQQYAAWAQAASAAAAANGYYFPLPPPHHHHQSPPSPYHGTQQQTMPQDQQQLLFSRSQQSHPQSSSYTHQYPQTLSHPHQNQAASYVAAQHLQHLYQAQNQYAGVPSALRPGGMMHPQPPPPPQNASQESTNVYQRHDSTGEQSPISWPQSQEQYFNPQISDDDSWVGGEVDSAFPQMATEPTVTASSPALTVSENVGASTLVTSTSTSKMMGVKSALLAPPPPPLKTPSGMSSTNIRTGATTVTEPVETSTNIEVYQLDEDSEIMIAGAGTKITFDSIHKLIFASISIALLSYCAVSPRSAPFPEYNRLFLQNLSIVGVGTVIAPIILFLGAFDGRYNNINTAIGTFHVSFTLGYALAFVSEIIVTTAVRLGVFRIWEPQIFALTPKVPSIILPWILREKHYKPKRITLFAADFGASCIASPIIEEYLKLRLVQWTCKLPRNFKLIKKVSKSRRKRKQYSLQPVRSVDDQQVTNINCYVIQMLSASLGLKLIDTTRRILMYTKETDDNKLAYAICRGMFPIHELCGTMTALLLARKDVLGVNLPLWKILGPAVFLHGMANFRGMKPIFKWNSSTPWSEMQINQLRQGGDPTWKQLLPKTYAKLVWLTILFRVFGFCIKNYYLVGRQAIKRTTTYSGKLHAFNAKLQTDAMLKRAKND